MKRGIRFLTLALLSSGILAVSSCKKKDDDTKPAISTQHYRVSQIIGDSDQYTYTYNSNNKLILRTGVHTDYKDTVIYEYTGDFLSKVSTSNAYNDGFSTHDYDTYMQNGNNISVLHYSDNELSEAETLEMQNGRMIKSTKTDRSGGMNTPEGFETYTYDTKGNLTRVEDHDTTGALTLELQLQYDDQKNPFSGYLPFIDLTESPFPNNLTLLHDVTDGLDLVKYTYTYNSDGYPDKSVQESTLTGSSVRTNNVYKYETY
jgi:YD repeat-containing protein